MSSQQVKSSKRTTSCDNRDQFDVIGVLLHGGRDVYRRSWMQPVRFRGVGGAGRQPRRQESTSSWPWLLLPVATTVPSGRHPTVCRCPAATARRPGTATSSTTGSRASFRFRKNKEPGRAPAALRWLRRGGWASQERPCRVRSHTGRRPIDLTSSASAFSSSTETLTRLLAKALSGRPWTISHSPL